MGVDDLVAVVNAQLDVSDGAQDLIPLLLAECRPLGPVVVVGRNGCHVVM